MKQLLICLFFLLFSTALAAQWDSVGVPCRPMITNLQTAQNAVYATTGGNRVFKSSDHGLSWQYAFSAYYFSINPANQRFYRFSDDFSQVEVSLDAGSNWAFLAGNPFGTPPYSRFEFSGDTVFLYAGNKLFRLEGAVWSPVQVPEGISSSQYIIIGPHIWTSSFNLLAHSADGGAHWDTLSLPGMPYQFLRIAAVGNTLLINYFDPAQQSEMLRRTTDMGQTWTTHAIPGKLWNTGKVPYFLFHNPLNQNKYASTNGVNDWEALDTWAMPNFLLDINGVRVAGLPLGIQYFQNGAWNTPTFGQNIPNEMSYAELLIQKTDGFLLFGGENGYGLAKLPDGGAAWALSNQPFFPKFPARFGDHLIGSGNAGTYRADLGGPDFEWSRINNQGGLLFRTNQTLYQYNHYTYEIFRSDDEGLSWSLRGKTPTPETSFYEADNWLILQEGTFYMQLGNNLLASEDEGATWSVRYTFPGQLDGDASRLYTLNGKIIMSHVTRQEVYISEDQGFSFYLSPAPKSTPFTGAYRLRLHGGVLFLLIGNNKFYQSTDEGQSWQKLTGPYPGFQFDPAIANNSFTFADDQVYYFDASKGVIWGAALAQTLAPPCESVEITMPAAQCSTQLIIQVTNTTPDMVYKWYRNGSLIQQGNNYQPSFIGHVGSQYVLVVSSPSFGCSVSDTTIILPVPVAQISYPDILPCSLEFTELDLSASTKAPGVIHEIFGYSEEQGGFHYSNQFDAAGNPSNPASPLVGPGSYNLWVTDQRSGCTATDAAYIARDPNETIGDLFTSPTNCNAADGVAMITNNGDPAIGYSWSTQLADSIASGLAPGWYSVTVTNGFCVARRNFEIVESLDCLVKIKGTVMNDGFDQDCIPAFGTQYVQHAMLRLLPDSVYTFTDAIGNYEFTRPPGTYTVELVDQGQYELLCPTLGALTVQVSNYGDISTGNHFFLKPRAVENLSIAVISGPPVPGFQQSFHASVCNLGSEPVYNIQIVFTHDALLGNNYPSAYFSDYDPTTYTAVANGFNLQPNQCTSLDFTLQTPVGIPLGTVLQYAIRVLPDDGDRNLADNYQNWQSTVVGSYDPNDKQVSPGETENGGKIFEADTLLRYNIRFQNTGTYPATTVEIRDTLDENLDVTTIQLLGSSHSSNLRLLFEGQNVLIFRFENINLPDSTTDFTYSQGFVAFSIKRKPGFVPGTEIRNRAAIYFDFNQPVITNEVVSILSLPLGLSPEPAWEAQLFPNPNDGVFTVRLPEAAPQDFAFRLVNALGETMAVQTIPTGTEAFSVQIQHVPDGIYLLQFLEHGKTIGGGKLIKQR